MPRSLPRTSVTIDQIWLVVSSVNSPEGDLRHRSREQGVILKFQSHVLPVGGEVDGGWGGQGSQGCYLCILGFHSPLRSSDNPSVIILCSDNRVRGYTEGVIVESSVIMGLDHPRGFVKFLHVPRHPICCTTYVTPFLARFFFSLN